MIAKSRKEIRAGDANISAKIREARLIWFGHVKRKTEEESQASTLPLAGMKSRFSRAIPLSRFSVKMSRFFACFRLIVQRIYLYYCVGFACLYTGVGLSPGIIARAKSV